MSVYTEKITLSPADDEGAHVPAKEQVQPVRKHFVHQLCAGEDESLGGLRETYECRGCLFKLI